ncbi:hypothetical protein MJA45_15610 [Paenibacillus aurantius]|uniref:IDEAL domain-containing protein n=1 Tax=Paenibacillus aurantius TaxID=2918900 RepID=A0AA96RFK4_9BACL|nr:hypothetical protein [Paenibacillus aurantius]WNQ09074.1 hypothetical protein MJA45_15610 [Paenibacillus aurantius]
MREEQNRDWKAGDWVSGVSTLDEFFIGYLDSASEGQLWKVWVTQSDHESIVGERVEARSSKLKKLPETSALTAEDRRALMELALLTHDKEWFQALAEQQEQAASPAAAPSAGKRGNRPVNRLFGTIPPDTTY